MIQGACVYRNEYDIPVLEMYKEIYKGYVLDVIYCNGNISINYVKTKKFTAMFPKHSVHVVYELPGIEKIYENELSFNTLSTYKLIEIWKDYVKQKLLL